MNTLNYRLYLVTDNPSRYAGNWLDTLVAALDGGVTCVQYRDTESAPKVQYGRIRALQDILRARRVPLVVNNDADLALAVRAEGVHVGQSDRTPAEVRAHVGSRMDIGLSITAPAQLDDARLRDPRARVDALGLGPVFDATSTKRDAARALGPERLAGLCRTLRADAFTQPLARIAIGGITLANAASVLAAGAESLAVVSALSKAEDPCAVARAFRKIIGEARS